MPKDAASLRRRLARDEIYTYWGRKASKNEREPELMFINARPWVKRKPAPDLKWDIMHEGTIRHGKMLSVYCDYHIWGMLREDWEQMKA